MSGVVFFAIAARALAPVDFGLLAVWQAVLGYAVVFAEFGTGHVASRRIAAHDTSVFGERLSTAVFLLRALGAATGVIITSIAFLLASPREVPAIWIWLLGIIVCLTAVNAEWWHLGHHHETRVACARLVRHGIVLIGSFGLVVGGPAWVAPAIYVAGAAAQTSVAGRGLAVSVSGCRNSDLGALARECWPLALALLAQQAVWSSALVISAGAQEPEAFGGLAIGYRCYSVGIALLAAYAAYLLPRSAAAKAKSEDDFAQWMALARRRAWLGSAGVLVAAPTIGWFVVPVVFGSRYPSVELLATLYLSALIPVIWRITSSNALVALGRTSLYCAISVGSALCALGLAVALPREWVFAPIAVAVFGEVLFAVASYIGLHRSLVSA